MGNQEENAQMLGGKGSLEIFLFTNGQQDSPPRKYNVRVSDRWDTTLNFLARSQNGSNHAIELYTTEGRKIERRQELSNGATYVAVEPPHAFLPAGYNEYLMKASRSREKRQEKISENDSLTKPDKNNSKDKMEEGSKNVTNIKIIQDITIRSTSKTAVEEQGDITNQVKSDIAKAVKPIRRMSIKQPQKRNNSLPQQSPHALRKYANNITPPIKRGNNPSKIDPSKKKVENPPNQNTKNSISSAKDGSIITKTNESNSKDGEPAVIGVISRTSNTVETYHIQKDTDMASMPGTGVTGYKATQNSTPVSPIIEKNILLPVSQEKKTHESAYIIPIQMRSKTLLSNGRDTVSDPTPDGKNIPDILNSSPLIVSSHADFPKEINRTDSRAGVLTNTPSERFHKKTLIFGSQTNENNFAIYIKKGNMVNLKLNIEVENVSSTTFEGNHNQIFTSSVEITPIKRFDGSAPANNAGKNYRDAPTLTEPWLGGLPYVQLQQITNGLRVGVCNCCSCSRYPDSVAPVYFDNNNYYILLPPEDINEHLVSCTCKLEINQQSKCEIPKIVKLSRIENHVVKLDGGHIPTHTYNITENSDIGKNSTIHNPVSNLCKGEVNQCDCYMNSAQYQTSPCDCAQSLALECPACDHEQTTRSDVVKLNAPANNKSKIYMEAFTQTDWSGLVLEARPRDDGSYAFHIPSLKVLKNANYLYY